jgi:hypothetical protein
VPEHRERARTRGRTSQRATGTTGCAERLSAGADRVAR